jgi:hypothetical protein
MRQECASLRLIFNTLSTDLSTGVNKGGVGWDTDLIPEGNCAPKRAFSNSNFDQGPATFSLVGQEHANIGMEKLDT